MGILDRIFGKKNNTQIGASFSLQNDIETACLTLKKIYMSNNRYTETFMHGYVNIMRNIDRRIREREVDPSYYENIVMYMQLGDIRNFTDLVLFQIYVCCISPVSMDLSGFCSLYREYVQDRLLFHHLPTLYVCSDNTYLTRELLEGKS